jgi:hypothetical protein
MTQLSSRQPRSLKRGALLRRYRKGRACRDTCGDCIHYAPSPRHEGQGYCPVCFHRNEWGELEVGKPIAAQDAACSRYELNCPF